VNISCNYDEIRFVNNFYSNLSPLAFCRTQVFVLVFREVHDVYPVTLKNHATNSRKCISVIVLSIFILIPSYKILVLKLNLLEQKMHEEDTN